MLRVEEYVGNPLVLASTASMELLGETTGDKVTFSAVPEVRVTVMVTAPHRPWIRVRAEGVIVRV